MVGVVTLNIDGVRHRLAIFCFLRGLTFACLVEEVTADNGDRFLILDFQQVALFDSVYYHTSLPTGSSRFISEDRFSCPLYRAARSCKLRR